MNLTPLKIITPKSHTRIHCIECGRKRDRGYISKLKICRVCFRRSATSFGFRKY